MKTRLAYIVELDITTEVALVTKRSNHTYLVRRVQRDEKNKIIGTTTFHTVHERDLTLIKVPNPPRFKFIDPAEVMKIGTKYWGTCHYPSPFKAEGGASWMGALAQPKVSFVR